MYFLFKYNSNYATTLYVKWNNLKVAQHVYTFTCAEQCNWLNHTDISKNKENSPFETACIQVFNKAIMQSTSITCQISHCALLSMLLIYIPISIWCHLRPVLLIHHPQRCTTAVVSNEKSRDSTHMCESCFLIGAEAGDKLSNTVPKWLLLCQWARWLGRIVSLQPRPYCNN